MNMKISKRDQYLLIALAGIVLLALIWFLVAKPLSEKTDALKTENITLKSTSELYQTINANRTEYEQGLVTLQEEKDAIIAQYPADIITTDKIMYLANLENFFVNDIAVAGIAMASQEEVIPGNAQDSTQTEAPTDATQETVDNMENQMGESDTDLTVTETGVSNGTVESNVGVHMYKMPVNYTFRATYNGVKNMLNYLYAQGDKKSIYGLTLAFDSETGNLYGNMDLDFYYMLGLEKAYEPTSVPPVRKGVPNVFHTINDGNVNAVLENNVAADNAGENEE